jgi:hypothetical protein
LLDQLQARDPRNVAFPASTKARDDNDNNNYYSIDNRIVILCSIYDAKADCSALRFLSYFSIKKDEIDFFTPSWMRW